jgi:ATP-dependent Clp protease ATP-binding subunit ClpB
MRIDKLTTKFQEALGEAQTLALGSDHAYITTGPRAGGHAAPGRRPQGLLQRAGVNVPGLLAAAEVA